METYEHSGQQLDIMHKIVLRHYKSRLVACWGVWQDRDKEVQKAMVYDSQRQRKGAWIRMPMKMRK